MKKIIFFMLCLYFSNSFAIYVDAGLGFGTADTKIDGYDFGDHCVGCSDLAVDLGLRMGDQINERFWIAGELNGIGNRYYDSYNYIQFNTYFIGSSFIYYPAEHFQLSGSIGLALSSNGTDLDLYILNGTGMALSLTAAFDTGINNGALIGAKFYFSSLTLEENNKDLSTIGFLVFIRFVHK